MGDYRSPSIVGPLERSVDVLARINDNMLLERLAVPFDDTTHQELDKAVNDAMEDELPEGPLVSRFDFCLLLHFIIHYCQGYLGSNYLGRCTKFIKEVAELREVLSEAWQQKSYREIRNLAILRSAASLQKQYMQSASKSSFFKGEYRGAVADSFYEYLIRNEKLFNKPEGDEKYHAKLCTIIQSSGTGKSRMLTELGRKDVIVIYLNIREEDENYYFPPRDQVPADILTSFVDCSEGRYWEVCYNFFIALFDTIEEYLSELLATENAQARIMEWRKQMCDMSYPPTSTTRADFFKKLGDNYNKADNRVGDNSFDMLLVESARNLSALLDRTFPDHSFKPKLVIAIDDAHTLMQQWGYRPTDVLRNLVKCYSHYVKGAAVWVVLASANSGITDFSPPTKVYSSSRIALLGSKLFPPYTQLGWDQNASRVDIDVEKVSLTEHIAGYGRPLWLSLRSVVDGSKNVLDLTSAKLCGRWYDPANGDQVLAVFEQRFAVTVTFCHPSSVEHLEKGVASHLRVSLAPTMDRKWWFKSYPSEPFVSCAAAINLHRNDENLGASLETLSTLVDQDMVDMGQRGELISRLLWLVAKDLYIRKHLKLPNEFPSEWDEHLIDCRMISVVDWLEFVFGPRIWSEENGEASLARKTFGNAYLNFSHWVCMDRILAGSGDDNELPLDLLTLRLWQRTSAVQCWHQQPLVDKVIPMYFKDESILSTKGRMSQIFISDRVREISDSKDALNDVTRRHENIGGGASAFDSGSPPYIVIMADLGRPPSFSVSFTGGDIGDRCLRIYAAGIDSSTYPFLDKYPQVMKTLQKLVHILKMSETEGPYREYLDAQMRFGSTATATHLEWERGKNVPRLPGRLARGPSD